MKRWICLKRSSKYKMFFYIHLLIKLQFNFVLNQLLIKFYLLLKENKILKEDCSFLTTKNDIIIFESPMDSEEMGFSTELIFDKSVKILEVKKQFYLKSHFFFLFKKNT